MGVPRETRFMNKLLRKKKTHHCNSSRETHVYAHARVHGSRDATAAPSVTAYSYFYFLVILIWIER